jgi:16S rRNA (guanine(966)-N(2))-methyltransferase RsmD
MRVVAGKFRSRPLASMPGMDIRPTSDKLRETLFNVLCAGNGEALAGRTFLDLFAGTGAVGIEALSRGAGKVVFVESSANAVVLIRENLESLGVAEGYSIQRSDVTAALRRMANAGILADVVFLDPPYAGQALYQGTLEALALWSGVNAETVVIAEHDKRFDPGESVGALQRQRLLKQGDAALSFYRKIT